MMKVSPGDPIRIRAKDWNSISDISNNKPAETINIRSEKINRNAIIIKNMSDEKMPAFTPVMLGKISVKLDDENKVANLDELDELVVFEAGDIDTEYFTERGKYNSYDAGPPITTLDYDYPLITYDGYKYFQVAITQNEIEPGGIGTATINGASYLWANRVLIDKKNETRTDSIKYKEPVASSSSEHPVWYDLGYRSYYGVLHEKQYAQSINIGEWQKLYIKSFVDPADPVEYIETTNKYLVSSFPLFELISRTERYEMFGETECELVLVRFINEFYQEYMKHFQE